MSSRPSKSIEAHLKRALRDKAVCHRLLDVPESPRSARVSAHRLPSEASVQVLQSLTVLEVRSDLLRVSWNSASLERAHLARYLPEPLERVAVASVSEREAVCAYESLYSCQTRR